MDINGIIDKLNSELEKLNNIKKQSIDTNNFFTNDIHYNDDFTLKEDNEEETAPRMDLDACERIDYNQNTFNNIAYNDIEPDTETLDIVTTKENRLLNVQNMFKKTIRVSLKSFLISLTLSFLNLFI